MTRFIITIIALVLVMTGCASNSTHVGRAVKPKAVDIPYKVYTLGNGFTIAVKKTGEGRPVAIQLWVDGGSRSDPPDASGTAHLAEHSVFMGSRYLPPGKAERYLENMGGRVYGNTGHDFTYLGVTLPGPGWERAMDMLYDLAVHPTLDDGQVALQQKVAMLEIGQRSSDVELMVMENLFGAAYRMHPYRYPLTGTEWSVGKLTTDEVKAFHVSAFQPSSMTLVVVGNVEPSAVRDAAAKTFGALADVKVKKPPVRQEPDQFYSRNKKEVAPVALTYSAVGWHVCAASNGDIYALEVLKAILGGGRGARLFMELRERKGIVNDISAELYALKDPGMLVVIARQKDPDTRRLVSEILKQVNRLKDGLVREDELERAKHNVESSHMLKTETAEGQAYSLGYWLTVYGGDDPAGYIENIRKVTPADVRRVAQTYLGEGSYTLSVISPGDLKKEGH